MKLTPAYRREFYWKLLGGLHFVWPVVAGMLGILIALGMAVAIIEGWPLFDGVYFAFVTGLTVGYGDLVPSHVLSRILAIATAIHGILITALLAGVAVHALQDTTHDLDASDGPGCRSSANDVV